MAEYPPQRVLDYQKFVRHTDYKERVAQIVGWTIFVLSTAAPLYFVYLSIQALAGETTVVNTTIVTSITVGVGVSAFTAFVAWLKNRSQKRELERQRKRIIELEEMLNLRSRSQS